MGGAFFLLLYYHTLMILKKQLWKSHFNWTYCGKRQQLPTKVNSSNYFVF